MFQLVCQLAFLWLWKKCQFKQQALVSNGKALSCFVGKPATSARAQVSYQFYQSLRSFLSPAFFLPPPLSRNWVLALPCWRACILCFNAVLSVHTLKLLLTVWKQNWVPLSSTVLSESVSIFFHSICSILLCRWSHELHQLIWKWTERILAFSSHRQSTILAQDGFIITMDCFGHTNKYAATAITSRNLSSLYIL